LLSRGQLGEKLALKKLQSEGYRILGKNFRCRFGEIDIIAVDKNVLVFVEVKLRIGDEYGKAKTAVSRQKIRKIKTTGAFFMLTNSQFREQRVDLVAIDIEPKSKRVSIELIKNIDNIW